MQTLNTNVDYSQYKSFIWRKRIILLAAALVMLFFCLLSLKVGSAGLSISEILTVLSGGGNQQTRTIIFNLRLPRIAAAVAVGAALSLSGCIMQSVLRNPLASASTLGVSQGASFGAAAAIVYLGAGLQANANYGSASLTITNPVLVTVCAFIGGLFTTVLILALSKLRGSSPTTMVLAGVAISSMFGGGTTLIQYFADDVMISSVVYWTFGSLSRAGWSEIALIAVLATAAFIFFQLNRWNYNAMESGVHTAKSLGVSVDMLIPVSMAVCALISSVSVAFVGCISFIGLISPHIMRRFVGTDYRFLIPCSAFCGSSLLLAADIASRTLVAPAVLPIGALTSFLGAPLFLYLIMKRGGMR